VVLPDALVIIVPATKISPVDGDGKVLGIFTKVVDEPPDGVIAILIEATLFQIDPWNFFPAGTVYITTLEVPTEVAIWRGFANEVSEGETAIEESMA
jgi:hypothetical protein